MKKRDQPITEPDVVKALAHPMRVRILGVLDQRAASPSELATELDVPLANMSYHVRVLKALGMIKLVARKQRRGAIEHFYRAQTRPVITDDGWGRLPDIVKRAMIDANLATTGEYVRAAAERGGFSRSDIHLSRTTFACDEQAWREVSEELARSFRRLREIADAAADRLGDAVAEDEFPATAVMMLFEGGEPTERGSETATSSAGHKRRRSARPTGSRAVAGS